MWYLLQGIVNKINKFRINKMITRYYLEPIGITWSK